METDRLVRKAGKTFTTWRPWLSIKPSANLAGLLALPCRIAEFSCVPPHNEEEKTVDPDELSTTNTKLLNNYFWQMVIYIYKYIYILYIIYIYIYIYLFICLFIIYTYTVHIIYIYYIRLYMSDCENPRFTERTSTNLGRSHRLPHVCTIMIYGKLGGYRLQETAAFIYIYVMNWIICDIWVSLMWILEKYDDITLKRGIANLGRSHRLPRVFNNFHQFP